MSNTARPGAENRPQGRTRKVPKPEQVAAVRNDLIAAVRDAYIRGRRFHETTIYGTASNYTPPRVYDHGRQAVTLEHEIELVSGKESVWSKLVSGLLLRRVDPVDYVFVTLKSCIWRRRTPEPLQLLLPDFLDHWEELKKENDELIETALPTEQRIAANEFVMRTRFGGLSPWRAMACVLSYEGLPLSPLFRYCVAKSLMSEYPEHREIFLGYARRFLRKAAFQYVRGAAAYARHWAKVLPDGFAEKAERVYNRYFGEG